MVDAQIRLCIAKRERAELEDLARMLDRSLSAEVRHAIRVYNAAIRDLSRERTESEEGP